MKARNGFWAMVVVVALSVGTMTLATDFVWDGEGVSGGGGVENWTNISMWDQGVGYPDDTSDNATLADVTPSATCTFNAGSALTVNNLTITGASPTKMKLHVKDAALTVANLDLNDYAELDVDQDLTVTTGTTVSGTVWIEVAASTTFDMGDVDVDGASAVVKVVTIGTVTADQVVIDADGDAASRAFSWAGGTLDIENELSLKSAQSATTFIAKLWVRSGTVAIAAASGNGILSVDGGDDITRKAELDIDGTLTAEETQFKSGYVAMDVASGKTATGGDVIFEAGAIVTKTGPGTFKSGT